MKHSSSKQGLLLNKLSEKYMTDEETDIENDGFIQRTPKWRNSHLSKLFMKLDDKYSKSSKTDKARPMKPRRQGPYSDRMPPLNAPKWALSREFDEVGSSSAESSLLETESDELQSITDSGNDNGLTIHDNDSSVCTSDDINHNDQVHSDEDNDDDDNDSEWLFNVVGIEKN